ncbi:MAG: FG-GAP-like repeat-containing protein [Planctomycetota bacterium]
MPATTRTWAAPSAAAAICLLAFGCGDSSDDPVLPSSAEHVVVELEGGDRVEGRLLKKDDARLYVYVGGTIVPVEHRKVTSITSGTSGDAKIEDVKKLEIYHTAKRSVKSVKALVEELGPAIVVVKTPSGLGTGWFCNREGYLVTNNHVVAGERSITVTMFRKGAEGFGKKVLKKVRIIALNDDIDLALLKVEEEIGIDYPQLYIGDSTALKSGDPVFAIGNPLGLERSVSPGEVSKASRNMTGRLYIQTTAPIAPGNSGGPLFNERGEIVGVVNMGYIFRDGLGFAIPSKYVKEFLDNVEAFAYDQDNPNTGMQYMETPVTATDGSFAFTDADFIKAGHGISCLTLADLDGDGAKEIVFANNNKAEVGVIRRRRKGEEEKEQALDFEDINRLRDSERFKVATTVVSSKVFALGVADMNEDSRADIVYLGDIEGLAVLEQKEDGTFRPARKIDDVKPAKRREALRITDVDGDGKTDVFVLGEDEFSVFRSGGSREDFPLRSGHASRVKSFELMDVNGDGRRDVVFFAADKHYAACVRLQNAAGGFVEEFPVRSEITGPVDAYRAGDGTRFLTLDKGKNRVRELVFTEGPRPAVPGEVPVSVLAIPVGAGAAAGPGVELGDTDGDGKLEMIVCDGKRNEFVIYARTDSGFTPARSPSPRKVTQCELYVGESGRAGVFCFSSEDKIFGVSRVEKGKVSFPQPINTAGQVQFMQLEEDRGAGQELLWVEKVGSQYAVRVSAAKGLLGAAFDGRKGSIDVESRTLSFGPDEKRLKGSLAKRPSAVSFADFNSDGEADIVLYWSYSGKESLYVGLGGGRFKEVIKEQKFLELQKDQPLIVEDLDGDGARDVLLVMPGFVRTLKVDAKGKLYVERQINWKFDRVNRLAVYEKRGGAVRFLAMAGHKARIVELDAGAGEFTEIGRLDLSGLTVGKVKVGDVDGSGGPDLVTLSKGAILVLRTSPGRRTLSSEVIFNAKLDYFTYWNLRAADLDADGKDEVLLFDSRKAMFEVYRPGEGGELKVVLRHRLIEKTIFQRSQGTSYELPQELEIGDVNGDKRPDFVCILQDRMAIYLQGEPPK